MSSIHVVVLPPRDDQGLIAPRAVPSVEDFRSRAPEIAAGIQDVAGTIQAELDSGAQQPSNGAWSMDSVTLSFELALEAEAGVVIAKASTSATFSVEISWSRTPAADAAFDVRSG